MNSFVFILSNLFITLPQMLQKSHKDGNFSLWDLLLGNVRKINSIKLCKFYILKIHFSFQGVFTNSIIYYGFYANDTLIIGSQFAYNMPSAYFLTFLFCYLFICILLCFK